MNSYAGISLGAGLGFVIAALLGFVIIPLLKRIKFGQTILEEGPVWHKSKEGTPTMGGLMFILAIFIGLIIVLITDKFLHGNILMSGFVDTYSAKIKIWAGLLMALGFGIIGFADDFIKEKFKRNLGLTITQKSIAQILIILAYLAALYMGKCTYTFIPFKGNVELSWFFWPFGIIVIYLTVNAVNFTDGIDGLCSSVTAISGISIVFAALLKGFIGVSLISACMMGACLGYLIWNWHPAKVFMGDTGSMFLGGMIAALAYMIDAPFLILLFGIIYVIEMFSDVIQISYFKITHGKRIFKMAPIHHHFEMCGWGEIKICLVFMLVQILGGIFANLLIYFG